MTQFVIANNVNTQLAAAASSGATTLTLASSTNLPTLSAGQIMPLTLNDAATGQNYEIVYVTAISGVTLTVTRAQEGTGALNWSIGDYAYCAPTAGTVAMTSGNPNDTFQVAASTALTHAPQTGQVQRSAFNYAGLAGGTANAITATLSPAPASYTDYLMVTVRIAATNTGSVSLNVNGLGVVPVIGQGHQTLQGGELFAGGFATFAYSTNYSEAILLECTGGALQIAPATQSQHAVQLGQANTAYLGKQALITSSGTFTCPVIPGMPTYTMYATVIPGGGGGGGGGSALGSASTSGAAGGGGGGGAGVPIYKQAFTVASGQVLTATIGAAGNGGAGSTAIGTGAGNGTAGGNTTLTGSSPAVNLSATGGTFGTAGGNANGSSSSTVAPGGSGGSNGASGLFGILGNSIAVGGYSGAGGNSNIGQGGGSPPQAGGNSPGSNGHAGTGYGAGGSGGGGAAALTSTSAETGGNGGAGTAGAILLEW